MAWVATVATVAIGAGAAQAQPQPPGPAGADRPPMVRGGDGMGADGGPGHGGGRGGWRGHARDGGEGPAMEDRAPGMHGHSGGFGIERMLRRVGASDAQRDRIRDIWRAAAADLQAQRTQAKETHRRMAALMAAPQIDRAAVERLHAEQASAREQAGRRMLKARLDAAEVLTPEQRARLAESMQRRGPWGGDGPHGATAPAGGPRPPSR